MRQFVADASHELRTPLSAIRGYTELISATEHFSDDGQRSLNRVLEQSTRMSSLVENLLLLARLDEKHQLKKAPVNLGQLASEITEDFRITTPDHHWVTRVPDTPVVVNRPMPARCAGSSPTCWPTPASTPRRETPSRWRWTSTPPPKRPCFRSRTPGKASTRHSCPTSSSASPARIPHGQGRIAPLAPTPPPLPHATAASLTHPPTDSLPSGTAPPGWACPSRKPLRRPTAAHLVRPSPDTVFTVRLPLPSEVPAQAGEIRQAVQGLILHPA